MATAVTCVVTCMMTCVMTFMMTGMETWHKRGKRPRWAPIEEEHRHKNYHFHHYHHRSVMRFWCTARSGGIWCACPYLVHFLSVNHGSEQLGNGTWYFALSHELGIDWASEWTSAAQQSKASSVDCGVSCASERVHGKANVPVLTSQLQAYLNHRVVTSPHLLCVGPNMPCLLRWASQMVVLIAR